MGCHAPPIAIRTRAPGSEDCLATGLNEQLDEAALPSDTFEGVSLRDEASDDELCDLATLTGLHRSPSALRFLLGKSHTSFKTTSAMHVRPFPPHAKPVAPFGKLLAAHLAAARRLGCMQSYKSQNFNAPDRAHKRRIHCGA